MFRLRFLRVLLPLLLVFLGYLLWSNWNPRSTVHRKPNAAPAGTGPRAQNLSMVELGPDANRPFQVHSTRVAETHPDGSVHLEGIRDLAIQREDRGPLLVSAERGDREGPEGRQRWHFEEQVEFREADQALRLVLPVLDIDQQAGEARSAGDIRLYGSNLEGRASALVYGLQGQPGSLTEPTLEDALGGTMSAAHALLHDGIRDVELTGDVQVSQPGRQMTAGRLRLIRGPQDRLRQSVAEQEVRGNWSMEDGSTGAISGERLEIRWNGSGEMEFMALGGDALISRGDESLSASTIDAAHENGGWKVVAQDGVYVQGQFGGAPGLLRAERVKASLDSAFVVTEAEAEGRVSFEGRDLRAEAERGTFAGNSVIGGDVELHGNDLRKAHLAQGRTRVAGRTIRTDVHGERLSAQGLVEATLLPQQSDDGGEQRMQLFVAGQAVHFVSDALESEETGQRLTFTGSVRGWQGERNLAAGEVIVDQRHNTLQAQDAVLTRIPRETTGAVATEGDYIQIGADRLDYDDEQGMAVYLGQVRVRLVEGWLEAERVEVELALDSRQVREIRASDAVRIEFHRSSDGEMPRPISGTADRLVYKPALASVRLFGDEAPAVVRRIGEGGGTTKGRELHYRVDTGALDVESGEQGSGRIRS